MDPIDGLAVLRLVPELFQITKALEAAAPSRPAEPRCACRSNGVEASKRQIEE